MEINLKNVEEIIFFDQKMSSILPEFRHFLDQWRLGKTIPALAALGSQSVLDLLNSIGPEQIKKLEEYFETEVIVNKFDKNIVKNHSMKIDDSLCGYMGFKDFCIYRKDDQVSLTFWR
jgi:hypothetical protein